MAACDSAPSLLETTPLIFADTVSRLRQLADLHRLPFFGESWSASLASLEAGAAANGLIVEDCVDGQVPSCRASVCAVDESIWILSHNAALRHLPADECARLLAIERQRHEVVAQPLLRALDSVAARAKQRALHRWARFMLSSLMPPQQQSAPPSLPSNPTVPTRSRQYAILAGVVWDVAVRSLWRRGFRPWATLVRDDAARSGLLVASLRRRRLRSAWRLWRAQADEQYAERSLGGVARLRMRGLRARAMLQRWRVFARCSAQLRRSRGHSVPRKR